MSVLVQHLQNKLYLAADGSWVQRDANPAAFGNAVEAICFCIQRNFREVRLESTEGAARSETFLYPFGDDPTIEAQRKSLRKAWAESRRLKREQRLLVGRLPRF